MIIMKTKLCNSLNVFATNTNTKKPKINNPPPPPPPPPLVASGILKQILYRNLQEQTELCTNFFSCTSLSAFVLDL